MALTDGCVAYWTLDNTLTDATGNGYTLTNNGATYTASGKINGTYDFDGSNDYLSSSLLISNSPCTFSCWVKWGGKTSTVNAILGTYTSGGSVGMSLLINTNGTVIFQGGLSNTTSSAISSGVWYHIVGVRTTTQTILYLDGSAVATLTGSPNSTQTSTLSIGRSGDYNGWYFDGTIDEVGIWNRALSSTEVSQLWNSRNGLQYPFGASSGWSNKINNVTASKVDDVSVANISKVNNI